MEPRKQADLIPVKTGHAPILADTGWLPTHVLDGIAVAM
jgi:hypothetical protein